MKALIQFLYTYGEEVSLISGVITILSAIGTIISYIKARTARKRPMVVPRCYDARMLCKTKRHKGLAQHKKLHTEQEFQLGEEEKKIKDLLAMIGEIRISETDKDVPKGNFSNNVASNNSISNSKITLKNNSDNTIALICFFGFLSLTIICATICVVVYFVTH